MFPIFFSMDAQCRPLPQNWNENWIGPSRYIQRVPLNVTWGGRLTSKGLYENLHPVLSKSDDSDSVKSKLLMKFFSECHTMTS